MMMNIAVIDYGAGNLSSIAKAIEYVGYSSRRVSSSAAMQNIDVIVLPGVGAAGDTMKNLERLNLVEPIKNAVLSGIPFLGICIGLQVLFTTSDESPGKPCLNIIPGSVKRFSTSMKVPHMGWNQLKILLDHTIFENIRSSENFYFVHSFYAIPDDCELIAGETEYSHNFCSVLIKDNIIATQFHPEKSGKSGLRLLSNFLGFAKRLSG